MEYPEKNSLVGAFEELYDDLLRFLQWRTGNAERAADLAQDTYLRLVAAAGSERKIDNARAYIMQVANNLAIDSLRRDSRFSRREATADKAAALADPAPAADAYVLARERLRILDEALASLPPKPRRALLLHRVSGWTQSQIAADLQVSESMVIKYIAQALRHCRDWEAHKEGGGERQ